MARRVDWIIHERTQARIPLRLNVDTMFFEAEYQGTTYKNQNGDEVRREVLAAIEAHEKLEFHPLIELKYMPEKYLEGDTRMNVRLSLYAKRYYYAVSEGGGMVSAGWDDDRRVGTRKFEPELGGADFDPPCGGTVRSYWSDTEIYYLPHSEKLWGALSEIGASLFGAIHEIVLVAKDGDADSLEALASEISLIYDDPDRV